MSWSPNRSLALLAAAVAFATAAVPYPAHAQAGPEGLVVTLPSVGVSVVTEPVEITGGQLGTPVDPDHAGAYRVGGNLLLVGHLDWAGLLRPFSKLKLLQAGDPVLLSDGRSYRVLWWTTWRVEDDADSWPYASAPVQDALTLITCSGPFSLSQRMYLDRLVVRAVPEADFVTP